MQDLKVQPYNPYVDGYNGYYIRMREDGLTYEMSFYIDTTCYDVYNVCLSIYRKRKDIDSNFDEHVLTGKNPFKSYIFAKNAFDKLYDYCGKNSCIRVFATNNKRASAYEKVLKKYNFEKKFIHQKGLSCFAYIKDNRKEGFDD